MEGRGGRGLTGWLTNDGGSVRTIFWTFGAERARKEMERVHLKVLKEFPTNFGKKWELFGFQKR
jgi:hypothetical protein